jgi:hypothetical protein
MKNDLIIYHGSISVIEKPVFGGGKLHNDYGRGFYCTEELDLAKEWAVDEGVDGYANKYSIDMTDLKALDLSKDAGVLNWITILLQNRVFNLKSDIIKQGKRYLVEHYSLPVDDYDIIWGYRADDSYFAYAEAFLNNALSVQRLAGALRLGDLGEQIVLKSERSFERLRFLGYEVADSAEYYPLRQTRNMNARKAFLMSRREPASPEELYLIDIMRGASYDDPRV